MLMLMHAYILGRPEMQYACIVMGCLCFLLHEILYNSCTYVRHLLLEENWIQIALTSRSPLKSIYPTKRVVDCFSHLLTPFFFSWCLVGFEWRLKQLRGKCRPYRTKFALNQISQMEIERNNFPGFVLEFVRNRPVPPNQPDEGDGRGKEIEIKIEIRSR